MNLLRILLPVAFLALLPATASAQSAYYYRLTGLSAGSCTGTSGSVQLSGATITRSAYLPSGDVETATMTSSTGGFAIGTSNYNFSIGPIGPNATGVFQSGVTTTPGPEPVVVTVTITSNVANEFIARITCVAALAAPQFEALSPTTDSIGIPTLHPLGLALLSLLVAGCGGWYGWRRRRA